MVGGVERPAYDLLDDELVQVSGSCLRVDGSEPCGCEDN